jgi:hypothetical protein
VKDKWNFWLPAGMMIVFAITRWPAFMPESLQNFSAAYAIAFCAGIYFPARLRWILPLGTLLIMDVILNRFYYGAPLVDLYTLVKLATFAVIVWIGTRFSSKSSWLKLVGGGIFSALVFYFVTNVASWLYDPGYPKTLQGLIQALTTGLPGLPPTWTFLRNTLLSGGLFTGLFCGAMKLSEAPEESDSEAEEPAEEGGEETVPDKA